MRYLTIILLFSILFSCDIPKKTKLLSALPFSSTIKSSEKEIKTFQFLNISPPIDATISGTNITANLPTSISLKNLVPSFQFIGSGVQSNGFNQESGITSNDFSNEVIYSVVANDGSSLEYKVKINNTGFSILGSSGNINITGLSSSDSSLEMYYDTSGSTFKSFDNNTKIGVVLSNNTNFALSFKTQPKGKVCSLNGGTLSGIITNDVSFSINCVSGFLVGGKILSVLSTFTIGTNLASVTTIAGSFPPAAIAGTNDANGSSARFNNPLGMTSDGINLFIADNGNHCIRKYSIANGDVTTIAGLCGTSGTADGTETAARFNSPIQISTDGTNLYVCDRGNNTIRKINISTLEVTTLVGLAGVAGDIDGVGASARINFPNGITTDGNFLYISDRGNNKIKRVQISSGTVLTLAGNGIASSIDNAVGTNASINLPCDSVSVGTILYFVECSGNTLRKIDLNSSFPVTTLAGSGVSATIDGTGIAASFNNPHSIETDGINLFITEWAGKRIRRVGISSLEVVTISGADGYQDGVGASALFGEVGGITSDGNRLYFIDYGNHSIRRINNLPD